MPRIYEMKSNDYHSVKKSRKLQKHIGDHLQDLAAFAFLDSDGDTDEAVDSELRARAASEHKTSRSDLSSIVLNFEHELDENYRRTSSQTEGFLSEGKIVHDMPELSEAVKWDKVYEFKWKLVGKPVEPEDDQNLETFVERFKSTISKPPSEQPPTLLEPDLSQTESIVDEYNAVLPSLERVEAEGNFRKAADKLDELTRKTRRDPIDDFPSLGEFSDAEIYAHAKSIKAVMEEFLKQKVLSEATRSRSSKFIDKWFQATFTIFKSNMQVLSVIPAPYLIIVKGFICLIEVSPHYHSKEADFLRFHIS